MPPSLSFLTSRATAKEAVARLDIAPLLLTAALHAAALALMAWSEAGIVAKLVFLLTWGLLNFFWLALLRRPAISAALSLGLVAILIQLSLLKYEMIWMTVNFLDVLIVNADTVSYLRAIRPDLERQVLVALALALPVLCLLWWLDSLRVRVRGAVIGFSVCLAGLVGISLMYPHEDWQAFFDDSYVSKFSRSGVAAISALLTDGYLESDAAAGERLKSPADTACAPSGRPPHILLVHDESSFDIRVLPGVKVPADYGAHFQSSDGKARRFITEAVGGASWYAEYNVLAGLSARSFGRFAYYATHIAAGRVERGLPSALRRCGYRTFSLYPARGAFMSARRFQTTIGVQTFYDQDALASKDGVEPDRFYYDAALRMIGRERAGGPMFIFVYLSANHYPWDHRWRPELTPEWQNAGNQPHVDEYLRRQSMSFRDYADLLRRLEHQFPGESFLLVRYGDHQPDFASRMIEPSLDPATRSRRLMSYDPRYYTTYYAVDAVGFRPVRLGPALDAIEAAYLPLVVLEAAGLPLDPSFAEQKKILERCNGLFYGCAGGAEARRFNRLLIDAGLIKGL